jgi:hypothetical protein
MVNKNLTLTQRRINFTRDVAKLLDYAISLGIDFYIKEVERNVEYQEWLIQHGFSKTRTSKHISGLAIDIAIIKDGVFSQNIEDYRSLGEFWKQLGHTWGGDWQWKDIFHFEE